MLKDLRKMKKRHEENIQKFKDGNSNSRSQETSQELESIQNRAGDVMKRLQSIQTASSAKRLPAEKKVKTKKKTRKSSGGRESEMADDDDDEDDLDE
ncbi:hypothetical protein BSL78_29897 [Apostichopus japonicus]|uniref:Uncharacterized protein n=1 Tax=Stichopus japonicus TaxID=307972 RepID=A0A2G8JC13_STIJA|nr:hypothetical protein BSL78_29897 [Apostichopus japonicus]